jgi:hypothetical protein
MGYNRTQWVDRQIEVGEEDKYIIERAGELDEIVDVFKKGVVLDGTKVDAQKLNNIETGIEQNNLFNLLLTPGRYKSTQFNTPTAGDVTETIYITEGNVVFATLVTEFDTPSVGAITETLQCDELGILNKVTTLFDVGAFDVLENAEEV